MSRCSQEVWSDPSLQVLSSDDEMLSLELGTLCKRYPDVSHDQLLCLLLLRGDLARAEAKQLAGEFVPEVGTANKTLHARSILSQVRRNRSLHHSHSRPPGRGHLQSHGQTQPLHQGVARSSAETLFVNIYNLVLIQIMKSLKNILRNSFIVLFISNAPQQYTFG